MPWTAKHLPDIRTANDMRSAGMTEDEITAVAQLVARGFAVTIIPPTGPTDSPHYIPSAELERAMYEAADDHNRFLTETWVD